MNEQSTSLTISKPKDLQVYLEKFKSSIRMALPKHLNEERMIRLAMTCFSTNPALRKCTPQSILSAIIIASQVGLEPGIAGQGYLIPYKDQCTFVPGWQGLVGLLNNTGRATAWTGAVYDGDDWVFELGSRPRCQHIPGPNYGDADKLRWVYACGKVNGSEQPVVEAWSMARVWKHRDKFNKVGARHYSFQNQEMYARKVVLLQVLKYMPRSIELNNAIVAADAAELSRSVTVEDGVIVELPPSGPEFDAETTDVPTKAIEQKPTKPAEEPKPASVLHVAAQTNGPGPQEERTMGEFLSDLGVDVGDFLGFLESDGRLKDASLLTTLDEVPQAVLDKVRGDAKAMARIVRLYGKKEEAK